MNEFEKKYVNNIYDEICKEFSNTRQHPWSIVKTFINSLNSNSLVCDIGSGNGKNIYRKDIQYIATDFSKEMCKLSYLKTDTIQSNILCLDDIF